MFGFANFISQIAAGSGGISDQLGDPKATNIFKNIGRFFGEWRFMVAIGNALMWVIVSMMRFILNFIDFMQYFVKHLIGLDYWDGEVSLETIGDSDVIFKFLYNENVQKVFRYMIGVFVVLLIVFSIIAIVKNEYAVATETEKASNEPIIVFRRAGKAILMVVLVPVLLLFGLISSNAILASLVKAFNVNNRISLGNQIFVASAYEANRYRIYADENLRYSVNNTVNVYLMKDTNDATLCRAVGEYSSGNFVPKFEELTEEQAESRSRSDLWQHKITVSIKPVVPMLKTVLNPFVGLMFNFKGEDYLMEIPDEDLKSYTWVDFNGNNEEDNDEKVANVEFYYHYLTDMLGAKVYNKAYVLSLGLNLGKLKDVFANAFKSFSGDKVVNTYLISASLSSYNGWDKVIQAAYNSWFYNSIFADDNRAFENTLTSLSDPFTSDSGKTYAGAKRYTNNTTWGILHDGGYTNSYVALRDEYYVMADVVDFAISEGVQLAIVNINNTSIKWDYAGEGGYLKTSYVKSKSGGIETGIQKFAVSYVNDGIATYYNGKTQGLAESDGAIYIVAYYNGEHFIPLVNNATYTDSLGSYKFTSNYLTPEYEGLIVARGILEGGYTNPTGFPTEITTERVLSATGEPVEENTPYYFKSNVSSITVAPEKVVTYDIGLQTDRSTPVLQISDISDDSDKISASLPTTIYYNYFEGVNNQAASLSNITWTEVSGSNGTQYLSSQKVTTKDGLKDLYCCVEIGTGSDEGKLKLTFKYGSASGTDIKFNIVPDETNKVSFSSGTYNFIFPQAKKTIHDADHVGYLKAGSVDTDNKIYKANIIELFPEVTGSIIKPLQDTTTTPATNNLTIKINNNNATVYKRDTNTEINLANCQFQELPGTREYVSDKVVNYYFALYEKDASNNYRLDYYKIEFGGVTVYNQLIRFKVTATVNDAGNEETYTIMSYDTYQLEVDGTVVKVAGNVQYFNLYDDQCTLKKTETARNTYCVNFDGINTYFFYLKETLKNGSVITMEPLGVDNYQMLKVGITSYNKYTRDINGTIKTYKFASGIGSKFDDGVQLGSKLIYANPSEIDFVASERNVENKWAQTIALKSNGETVATFDLISNIELTSQTDLVDLRSGLEGANSVTQYGETLYKMIRVDDEAVANAAFFFRDAIRFKSSRVSSLGSSKLDFSFSVFDGMRLNFSLFSSYDAASDVTNDYYIKDGIFFLDYNFSDPTHQRGLNLTKYYFPMHVNILVLVFSAFVLIRVLGQAVWGIIQRIFDITLYFVVLPGVAATMPIDDGSRFKTWKDNLIKKVLATYGVMIGINFFFIILPAIKSASHLFNGTDLKDNLSIGNVFAHFDPTYINQLVYILFVLVAITMIKSLPSIIAQLIGADDVYTEGAKVKKAVKETVTEVGKGVSGEGLKTQFDEAKKIFKSSIPGSAIFGPIIDKWKGVWGKKDGKDGKDGKDSRNVPDSYSFHMGDTSEAEKERLKGIELLNQANAMNTSTNGAGRPSGGETPNGEEVHTYVRPQLGIPDWDPSSVIGERIPVENGERNADAENSTVYSDDTLPGVGYWDVAPASEHMQEFANTDEAGAISEVNKYLTQQEQQDMDWHVALALAAERSLAAKNLAVSQGADPEEFAHEIAEHGVDARNKYLSAQEESWLSPQAALALANKRAWEAKHKYAAPLVDTTTAQGEKAGGAGDAAQTGEQTSKPAGRTRIIPRGPVMLADHMEVGDDATTDDKMQASTFNFEGALKAAQEHGNIISPETDINEHNAEYAQDVVDQAKELSSVLDDKLGELEDRMEELMKDIEDRTAAVDQTVQEHAYEENMDAADSIAGWQAEKDQKIADHKKAVEAREEEIGFDAMRIEELEQQIAQAQQFDEEYKKQHAAWARSKNDGRKIGTTSNWDEHQFGGVAFRGEIISSSEQRDKVLEQMGKDMNELEALRTKKYDEIADVDTSAEDAHIKALEGAIEERGRIETQKKNLDSVGDEFNSRTAYKEFVDSTIDKFRNNIPDKEKPEPDPKKPEPPKQDTTSVQALIEKARLYAESAGHSAKAAKLYTDAIASSEIKVGGSDGTETSETVAGQKDKVTTIAAPGTISLSTDQAEALRNSGVTVDESAKFTEGQIREIEKKLVSSKAAQAELRTALRAHGMTEKDLDTEDIAMKALNRKYNFARMSSEDQKKVKAANKEVLKELLEKKEKKDAAAKVYAQTVYNAASVNHTEYVKTNISSRKNSINAIEKNRADMIKSLEKERKNGTLTNEREKRYLTEIDGMEKTIKGLRTEMSQFKKTGKIKSSELSKAFAQPFSKYPDVQKEMRKNYTSEINKVLKKAPKDYERSARRALNARAAMSESKMYQKFLNKAVAELQQKQQNQGLNSRQMSQLKSMTSQLASLKEAEKALVSQQKKLRSAVKTLNAQSKTQKYKLNSKIPKINTSIHTDPYGK